MYGRDTAECVGQMSKSLSGLSAGPSAPRPMPTLEGLIQNTVDFVSQIKETRDQTARIRGRLMGPWPESASKNGDTPAVGMLDALDVFHQDAWRTLRDLQDNLNAIQASLG